MKLWVPQSGILGHEAGTVVESVGEGVTGLGLSFLGGF